jgi:hypothetical protein
MGRTKFETPPVEPVLRMAAVQEKEEGRRQAGGQTGRNKASRQADGEGRSVATHKAGNLGAYEGVA